MFADTSAAFQTENGDSHILMNSCDIGLIAWPSWRKPRPEHVKAKAFL
jgi:hypothetical protein